MQRVERFHPRLPAPRHPRHVHLGTRGFVGGVETRGGVWRSGVQTHVPRTRRGMSRRSPPVTYLGTCRHSALARVRYRNYPPTQTHCLGDQTPRTSPLRRSRNRNQTHRVTVMCPLLLRSSPNASRTKKHPPPPPMTPCENGEARVIASRRKEAKEPTTRVNRSVEI